MIDRLNRVLAGRDRGSEPVAMAIAGVGFLAILGVIAIAGRVSIAASSMSDVAGSAARDASIARTASQAQRLAYASAEQTLRAQDLHCQGGPDVYVDTAGFAAAPGAPASIRVDVTCVVALSDVAFPGLPGSHTLHDTATSPLDPFRTSR